MGIIRNIISLTIVIALIVLVAFLMMWGKMLIQGGAT